MTDQALHLDTPARYRIRVRGYLEESWSSALCCMSIACSSLAGQGPVTTLCGPLVDQAALLGVLNGLYSLRLPLLSVECLGVNASDSAPVVG
jgi:hypothetical protein